VVTPSQNTAHEWTRFARELATMEDLVTRLLIEHVPDDAGRCTHCTTPGSGTPRLRWPCALWTLARTAQRIRSTWDPSRTGLSTLHPRDRRSGAS
jgi:hypothetical protein